MALETGVHALVSRGHTRPVFLTSSNGQNWVVDGLGSYRTASSKGALVPLSPPLPTSQHDGQVIVNLV